MPVIERYEVHTVTLHYLIAALWSSTDDEGEPLDKNFELCDLAPETIERAESDCSTFLAANFADIPVEQYQQAGHDFWLTRNRHGAGFWDGDWPDEAGRRLSEASYAFGEIDLYVGDDGLLYFG